MKGCQPFHAGDHVRVRPGFLSTAPLGLVVHRCVYRHDAWWAFCHPVPDEPLAASKIELVEAGPGRRRAERTAPPLTQRTT